MNYESEMKTRKERPVRSEKEGAAIRQDTRSNRNAAKSRTPYPSIPAWQEEEEWSTGKTALVMVVGFLFLFSFMWLAAAY